LIDWFIIFLDLIQLFDIILLNFVFYLIQLLDIILFIYLLFLDWIQLLDEYITFFKI